MKKFIIIQMGLFSLLFIPSLCFSQIEITWPDPTPEKTISVDIDTSINLDGFNLNQLGAQNWDFNKPIDAYTGNDFETLLNNSEDFPDAEWIVRYKQFFPGETINEMGQNIEIPAQLAQFTQFQRRSNGFIEELGSDLIYSVLNEGEGGPFEYPEPAQVYPNPLTHDSEPWVLKRYLEGEITIGSLNLPGSISDSTIVEVDAWGILTLTTQSKSYQCLRLKKHEFRTIGIDPFPIFLPGGYSRVIETYTYSWITTHFDVVLELTSSANNGEYFSKADIAVLATNITPNVNGIDCDPCRTDNMPEQFFLEQNFPNPFNPTTQFQYTLLEPAEVQIFIFNVLGQPISVMDEGFKGIGTYRVTWNAKNPNSTPLTSGIYFYKLHAKAMDGSIFTQKRKMILTK